LIVSLFFLLLPPNFFWFPLFRPLQYQPRFKVKPEARQRPYSVFPFFNLDLHCNSGLEFCITLSFPWNKFYNHVLITESSNWKPFLILTKYWL
jgi:hypothetical protein